MTSKLYLNEDKQFFSKFELQQKKQRMLKRKDEIREQFYKSIATTVMEAML